MILTNRMVAIVPRFTSLTLYVDARDTFSGRTWDDVAIQGPKEIPVLISSRKVIAVDKKETLTAFYDDIGYTPWVLRPALPKLKIRGRKRRNKGITGWG